MLESLPISSGGKVAKGELKDLIKSKGEKSMKVIVTGGASGIGKEVSDYLASEAFEVISVDLQENNNAKELDVTDEVAWTDLFEQVGPVQGLVNCAGIRTRGTIIETSMATFEQHLKVNVTGTWLGIRSLFKNHETGTEASIVNISSVNVNCSSRAGPLCSKQGSNLCTHQSCSDRGRSDGNTG